jgi:hypothetical protein
MNSLMLIIIKSVASQACEDAGRAAPPRHGRSQVAPMVLWGHA